MKYMWRDAMSGKAKKQRARTPHSLRSERFQLLREVSERENGEGVTAMTEAEVSGSLSLLGVSGGVGLVLPCVRVVGKMLSA